MIRSWLLRIRPKLGSCHRKVWYHSLASQSLWVSSLRGGWIYRSLQVVSAAKYWLSLHHSRYLKINCCISRARQPMANQSTSPTAKEKGAISWRSWEIFRLVQWSLFTTLFKLWADRELESTQSRHTDKAKSIWPWPSLSIRPSSIDKSLVFALGFWWTLVWLIRCLVGLRRGRCYLIQRNLWSLLGLEQE